MVNKAFNNLLKHMGKLPQTKKKQAFQWEKHSVDGRLVLIELTVGIVEHRLILL
ncbi:hypothetical protein QRE66_16375 [Bacillus cereus]|nr:hypothetical protein QRE66_16375 [Bacillus cereus]